MVPSERTDAPSRALVFFASAAMATSASLASGATWYSSGVPHAEHSRDLPDEHAVPADGEVVGLGVDHRVRHLVLPRGPALAADHLDEERAGAAAKELFRRSMHSHGTSGGRSTHAGNRGRMEEIDSAPGRSFAALLSLRATCSIVRANSPACAGRAPRRSRFVMKAQAKGHSPRELRRLRSTFARTSSQVRPFQPGLRASSARRSISAAHSASVRESGGASRCSSNSAAKRLSPLPEVQEPHQGAFLRAQSCC